VLLALLPAGAGANSGAAPGSPWPDLGQPPAAAPGGGAKDAAVIVGIERYASVAEIPGALQNAHDWYSYLVQGRGIPVGRVHLLRNNEGTVEKMRRFAKEAAQEVGEGGTLWFVFVGHGAPGRDGRSGVLVGYDAQQDADSLFARSLPQDELTATLATGKQAHTVVLVDACFSGRTAAGQPLAVGLQPLLLSSGPIAATRTSLFLAGRSDQFAGPLPNASRPAFSYLMLGALRGWADHDADGNVTGSEAISFVRDTMRAVVVDRNQTPEAVGQELDAPLVNGREKGPNIAALVLGRLGGGAPRSEPPAATGPVSGTAPAPVQLAAAAPPPDARLRATAPPPPAPIAYDDGSPVLRGFGLALGTVGAIGVVVGTVSTMAALGASTELEETCQEMVCGPHQFDAVDDYNKYKRIASIGLIGGGAALVTGIVLQKIGAPEAKIGRVAVGGGVGTLAGAPASVSVGGRF
jgi:hypothetical protein